MLPHRVRVYLGAMEIKRYSTFAKSSKLEPRHKISFASYPGPSLGVESYPSAEMQSVYTTAPADWAVWHIDYNMYLPSFFTTSRMQFMTNFLIGVQLGWNMSFPSMTLVVAPKLNILARVRRDGFMLLLEALLLNHIYPTPPLGQDMTKGQFLSGV